MTTYVVLLESKTILHVKADYFVDDGDGRYSFWTLPETEKTDPLLVAHVRQAVSVGDFTSVTVSD